MIYLATPYSFNPAQGLLYARESALYLLRKGLPVFSPVLHWHETAKALNMPDDAKTWWSYNRNMLSFASTVAVYDTPETPSSKGVTMELDYADEHDIPVIRLSMKVVRYGQDNRYR